MAQRFHTRRQVQAYSMSRSKHQLVDKRRRWRTLPLPAETNDTQAKCCRRPWFPPDSPPGLRETGIAGKPTSNLDVSMWTDTPTQISVTKTRRVFWALDFTGRHETRIYWTRTGLGEKQGGEGQPHLTINHLWGMIGLQREKNEDDFARAMKRADSAKCQCRGREKNRYSMRSTGFDNFECALENPTRLVGGAAVTILRGANLCQKRPGIWLG